MRMEDIEIGKYYKIKDYKSRPRRWNSSGMMDRYFGQTVKVVAKKYGQTIKIDQGDDLRYSWAFTNDNFECPVDFLEDELFEI
jgi:hypothetical protein